MITFPQFYRLLDHDKLVAILIAPDINSLAEIEETCRKACVICEHRGLLGKCLDIERTTVEEWGKWHDG